MFVDWKSCYCNSKYYWCPTHQKPWPEPGRAWAYDFESQALYIASPTLSAFILGTYTRSINMSCLHGSGSITLSHYSAAAELSWHSYGGMSVAIDVIQFCTLEVLPHDDRCTNTREGSFSPHTIYEYHISIDWRAFTFGWACPLSWSSPIHALITLMVNVLWIRSWVNDILFIEALCTSDINQYHWQALHMAKAVVFPVSIWSNIRLWYYHPLAPETCWQYQHVSPLQCVAS